MLQEGDRVLAINGQYLENRTLDEAEHLLSETGMKVRLHVEFDVAGRASIFWDHAWYG